MTIPRDELSNYNDSHEICAALLSIAEECEPGQSYWLSEAATHIQGLYELAKIAVAHAVEPFQWSPVGAKPEVRVTTQVIIATNAGDVFPAYFNPKTGNFIDGYDGMRISNVAHWGFLPSAPSKGQEGE
jgi:hypothetical protein